MRRTSVVGSGRAPECRRKSIETLNGAGEPEPDTSPDFETPSIEVAVSKPLLFRGIITLNSRGKPLTAELSTIEAADDLGRRKWDEALAMSKLLENYSTVHTGLTLPPDLQEHYVQ